MLDDSGLISVIVPVYGIERYVGICIESLINQTYKNLEIILVDDGSLDRCPQICDLYAKKDDRVKVIHMRNGGLVSARQAGMETAKGEFVAYVDGDDWVEPQYFETLMDAMCSSGSDLVVSGYSRDLFEKREILMDAIPAGTYGKEELIALNPISNGKFFRAGISSFVWNKLFRKQVVHDVQLNVDPRIMIGEDACVVYPAVEKCSKVSVVGHAGYHYRQREDSMLKNSLEYEDERDKFRILYEYMLKTVYEADQIEDYVLANYFLRNGGLIGGYSAFGSDFIGKTIAVYSAGTFGQQFVKRAREHCNISVWVDDDYWEYRRCGLDVDPVSCLTKKSFDRVLVAALDGARSMEIGMRLRDMGVKGDAIICMREPDHKKELLGKLLA